MISVKHIKKYLNHLKPYMTAVKNLKPDLESGHMATLYGLEHQAESDALETALSSPTQNNFVYLCQAYLSVYGNGTILNSKIHDGWAISKILMWDAENLQVVNHREGNFENEDPEVKMFTLNLNESNHTTISADQLFLLLNRRDHQVGLQLDADSTTCTPCTQFYVNLQFNEVDTVVRGDHLSMLIDFKHLTKQQKDRDIKFASYMRKHAVEIASLAGHVFNKPIILPKVKVPKQPKAPKPPKPSKYPKPPSKYVNPGKLGNEQPRQPPQPRISQHGNPAMPFSPPPPKPSANLLNTAGHHAVYDRQYNTRNSYLSPHVPYDQVIHNSMRNLQPLHNYSPRPQMQTTYPSYPPYQFEQTPPVQAAQMQQRPQLPILPNHLFSP